MAKILVVDDKYFVRFKLSAILSKADYTVIEAENGEQAIRVYEREKPDVVLLDIIMPVLDGISALKIIMEKNPDAKIVMLTSLSEQTIVDETTALGAKETIFKPFDEKIILETLKKYI